MEKKLLHKWYSICSRHYEYDKDCGLCNTGRWIFVPGLCLSKLLYKISSKFWIKFYNTQKRKQKFLNGFKDMKTGQKINPFPNLKK